MPAEFIEGPVRKVKSETLALQPCDFWPWLIVKNVQSVCWAVVEQTQSLSFKMWKLMWQSFLWRAAIFPLASSFTWWNITVTCCISNPSVWLHWNEASQSCSTFCSWCLCVVAFKQFVVILTCLYKTGKMTELLLEEKEGCSQTRVWWDLIAYRETLTGDRLFT